MKKIIYLFLLSFLFASTPDFYQNLINKETSLNVRESGHSYYLQHPSNNKIVLLVHGYTSNPAETVNLGKYLYNQGFDVFAIRLTGHGTTPENLKNTKWQEWYSSATEAYVFCSENYKNVYVFGVSAGALVGLKLAQNYHVSGLVVAGTFLYLNSNAKYAYWLYPITKLLHIPLGYIDVPIPPERQHITYLRNPIDSAVQLSYFAKDVKKQLRKVTCPILIMHCPNDDVAHPKSATYVFDKVKSANKKLVWAGKEHSFLIDTDEDLYKQLGDWFLGN